MLDEQLIPINVLLCDPDGGSARLAEGALRSSASVAELVTASTIEVAQNKLRANDINTIVIDPLGFDLDSAAEFIFGVRKALPEIVFVLFIKKSVAEKRRSEFYRGERSRFAHYYTLDKGTPLESFEDEVGAILHLCQQDLSWRLSKGSLDNLVKKAQRLISARQDSADVAPLEEFRSILSRWATASRREVHERKSVFVSHRFAEEDYVTGLTELLEQSGFVVVTGRAVESFIGKAVIQRIREAEFFLCLMTRADEKADGTFTTSAWLYQELGAALAHGKNLVIMVEEGVTDMGGLQGDWQQIRFGPKGFLKAAIEAVKQLKSYAGEE